MIDVFGSGRTVAKRECGIPRRRLSRAVVNTFSRQIVRRIRRISRGYIGLYREERRNAFQLCLSKFCRTIPFSLSLSLFGRDGIVVPIKSLDGLTPDYKSRCYLSAYSPLCRRLGIILSQRAAIIPEQLVTHLEPRRSKDVSTGFEHKCKIIQ